MEELDYDAELRGLPDPDRVRKVTFSVSCRGRGSAEWARRAAESDGFMVEVHRPGGRQRYWVIDISQVAVLTPEYLRQMAKKWIALAATLDEGQYGGHGYEWGDEWPPDDLGIAEYEQAYFAMVEELPAGWRLQQPQYDEKTGHFSVYAHDRAEGGRRGQRSRECSATASTQLEAVKQITECLRRHASGGKPFGPRLRRWLRRMS